MTKIEEHFYTMQRIDALRKTVEFYGLEVPLEFWNLSLPKLQKYCNGCGAENWSVIKRQALTAALSRYEAAFFVHDICYELMTDRAEADKMLLRNMRAIFRRDFGLFWWLTKRGWAERIGIIPVVYGLVAWGGEDAYQAARKDGDET
ncbi:MAG: hypothetical protein E7058_01640 [Lentisphaerae bacterium]|nr:hypothetical protein [Lentisphaerota bacterium]